MEEEDRATALLAGIDSRAKILEVGPSVSPLAPRSAGWDVIIVDHATRDELVEKYRPDPNVDITNVEEVDFVWRRGALHDAIPEALHGTFDVLIASHVIEHVPDPIGFLKSATRLLHPGHGIVVLAVPDKRWCFDCLKQVSSTGQFLAAHRLYAQRHSLATRFDHSAYIAFNNGRGGWGREQLTGLQLADSLDHAYAEFQGWSDDPQTPYIDCHAWHMTPASFELLILEAGSLGLCDWHVGWLKPRSGVEFFTHLLRGPTNFATPIARESQRLELLEKILLELREQSDWLAGPIAEREQAKQDAEDMHVRLSAAAADLLIAETERKAAEQQAEDLRLRLDAAAADLLISKTERDQQTAEIDRLHTVLLEVVRSCSFDKAAQEKLEQVTQVIAMIQTALRPARAIWHAILPLRRIVARLRGRI